MSTALMEQPEALINFENMTWTCSEHQVTLKLDSGVDCPQCLEVYHPPPRAARPRRDARL